MALLPQSPRDRNMVAIAALGVVAVVAFIWFVWQPKQQALATLQTRVDQLAERNDKIERELKRGNLAKLKA